MRQMQPRKHRGGRMNCEQKNPEKWLEAELAWKHLQELRNAGVAEQNKRKELK